MNKRNIAVFGLSSLIRLCKGMLLQYTALIDSHRHLDSSQFEADRAEVLACSGRPVWSRIVNPGIDLDHCRHALALAEEYAEVYVAVGIHPNSAHNVDAQALDDLRTGCASEGSCGW